MTYLKISRLDTDISSLKLFIWIFWSFTTISLLLGVFINHFLEVLLTFSPLFLLLWIFMKIIKGDNIIFTDSDICQTNLFKKKTKSIKHTEIKDIFAFTTSINILHTAIGSIGSTTRPSISSSRVPFSKILSNDEVVKNNFVVISKTPITDLNPVALADNKDCIILQARKEVVDLIIKIFPKYLKEN